MIYAGDKEHHPDQGSTTSAPSHTGCYDDLRMKMRNFDDKLFSGVESSRVAMCCKTRHCGMSLSLACHQFISHTANSSLSVICWPRAEEEEATTSPLL